MRSPLTAMIVIACPHCGTRYQVPAETLGPRGREVQCAHCTKSWLAAPGEPVAAPAAPPAPDPDRLFDARTERDLDAAFATAEQALLAETALAAGADCTQEQAPEASTAAPAPAPATNPRVDPRLRRKRAQALARRQNSMSARLPIARVRRVARLVTVGLLLALLSGGIALRTEIVRSLPDLAGAYAALGMEVNTVGLEFRDVHTLLALRSGGTAMQVKARIYSVAPRVVVVPPVVVTLLDRNGAPLYEWSVTPEARELEPGEVVDFASQLNSPPAGATRVRLIFAGGLTQSETQIAPAIQPPAP